MLINCTSKNDKVATKQNIAFYFVRRGDTDWGNENVLKDPQDLGFQWW